MELDDNKNRVRVWFDVFNTGEFDAIAEIHSEDCRNHAPGPFDTTEWPGEGKAFGPEEFRSTVEWIRRNQPDLRVEIDDLVAEDDQVVAWIHSTGTATGPGGPIPPTGAVIRFAQSHRFRFLDGRIVEHWAVRDDLRSMIQAGVVTPPSRALAG